MNEPTKPTSIIDADAPESRMADFSEIPLIDLAPIYGDDAKAKQRMAAALREACIRVGFFYVKNHGIPEANITMRDRPCYANGCHTSADGLFLER